jgi:hypothetical protein
LSFTSSQSATWRSAALHELLRLLDAQAVQLVAGEHVLADGHGGEGVGLLEHHAHAAAQAHGIHAAIVDVDAVERTLPVARAPGVTSCMRFRQRKNVDFPQPDGPMIAVTRRSGMRILMFLIAWNAPKYASSPDTSSFTG